MSFFRLLLSACIKEQQSIPAYQNSNDGCVNAWRGYDLSADYSAATGDA